jgi:hypothetical protein
MAEVSALRKHPCPECGGDAEWNPSKRALACPYCGTILPWTDPQNAFGAAIVEHDLVAALRRIGDERRGLREAKQSVRCESCRAISIFDPLRAAQRCEFCGSPSIVPVDGLRDEVTPESLLPCVIDATRVRDTLREWYGSRWWAPNRLKRAALTDTLHGMYLPYWTFDARVEADWTADAGYHYYVSETYRDGNGRMQTRQVRKTRWVPSAGNTAHFFDDLLVSGSVGVHAELLRKVEPFPTVSDLKPYDPAYVRGWTVERYQIDLRTAATTSEREMDSVMETLCAREVPGDTHRNLQVSTRHHGRTFKHVLVPVWLVSYNYGARAYQVVVNGYTGKLAGDHPLSWVKITFAVLVGLLLLLGLAYLFSGS